MTVASLVLSLVLSAPRVGATIPDLNAGRGKWIKVVVLIFYPQPVKTTAGV